MNTIDPSSKRRRQLTWVGSAAALVLLAPICPERTAQAATSEAALVCGSVVTRDVRLSRDLRGCTGNGLVVGADGVDIDLNGHLISGAGPFASLSGIEIDAHSSVRVHSGRIADFGRGVLGYDADQAQVTDVRITRTREGVNFEESSGVRVIDNHVLGNREGIVLRRTDRSTVAGNKVVDNDTAGITDIDSRVNLHLRNLVADNTFDGISLESAVSSVVADNTVHRNGLDGIDAVVGSGVRYSGNRVTRNGDNGINDSGTGTVWRGNIANRNVAVGLRNDGTDHVDGGGNRARGNGERECVGIRCR
jgi:parallel beta-helix repeat protein